MDSPPTSNDINSLFDKMTSGDGKQESIIQRLQAIRLWQLQQQEELKKQQQMQLALLKSQAMSEQNGKLIQDESAEVLAVPISSCLPNQLDTILELSNELSACNISDTGDEQVKPANISQKNDPILQKLHENLGGSYSDIANFKDNHIGEKEKLDENHEKDIILNEDDNHSSNERDAEIETIATTNLDEFHQDVQSSFEKSSNNIAFDEIPIKGRKTFAEILEEQLIEEKTATKSPRQKSASTPKRTFLRKGQGIARFNGPPRKSKFNSRCQTKENTKAYNIPLPATKNAQTNSPSLFQEAGDDDNFCSRSSPVQSKQSMSKTDSEEATVSNEHVKQKPCVRKTARLSRREPLKQLTLKPVVPVHSHTPVLITNNQEKCTNDRDTHNESMWSEVDDPVLDLDITGGHSVFNTSSNETFEQMEQFCNEHYADLTSVKTLDDDDSIIMRKIEPLPPNKLMQRLFPSLRPENKKKEKENTPPPALTAVVEEKSPSTSRLSGKNLLSSAESFQASGSQPALLKTKLKEMEGEIKRFQEETAKLTSVRHEEEKHLNILKQEFEEFQRQKEEELQRLNDFKKAETKKLKKDRKLFEEHVSAMKSLPNKQDRDYIKELENRITEIQDEAKVKEQRLSAVNSRLRSQVDVLTEDNEKLKEKVASLDEKVCKLEQEKEIKKNKKSQAVWNAINDIVDSIPNNDENVDIDKYIETHTHKSSVGHHKKMPNKSPLPTRNPLASRDENVDNSQVTAHEGKVEQRHKDGTLEISFQNGTKKLVFADGRTEIKFTNGDIKTVLPDGTEKYHYTLSGTWHTTHPNGMQVIEFSNNQVERHFPDGSKHISFKDGSSKMIKLDGTEETVFPDGTIMVIFPNGKKTIEFSNGQREVHTAEFKKREYPDGTCKTVYADGRQETKYSSGRLRIKDANGTLIVDKMV